MQARIDTSLMSLVEIKILTNLIGFESRTHCMELPVEGTAQGMCTTSPSCTIFSTKYFSQNIPDGN